MHVTVTLHVLCVNCHVYVTIYMYLVWSRAHDGKFTCTLPAIVVNISNERRKNISLKLL